MNHKVTLLVGLIIILGMNFASAGSGWNYGDTSFSTWDSPSNQYKEVTEYKKVTVNSFDNPWSSGSVKKTSIEKTEVTQKTKTPSYTYRYINNYPSYTNWRYKEPAYYRDWDDDRCDDRNVWCKNNYYYKPVYDYNLGHYNWRY